MTIATAVMDRPSALARLRSATRETHERLELRLDAIERLADEDQRPPLLRRYAALHVPADEALAPWLQDVPGLDFGARSRTPQLAPLAGDDPLPDFPQPASRAEALGMLYVLEGATLGGRLILRELSRRGVEDARLDFLDPYGSDTGRRWRDFLMVLERDAATDETALAAAEQGATRGFDHAERVLCGTAS